MSGQFSSSNDIDRVISDPQNIACGLALSRKRNFESATENVKVFDLKSASHSFELCALNKISFELSGPPVDLRFPVFGINVGEFSAK